MRHHQKGLERNLSWRGHWRGSRHYFSWHTFPAQFLHVRPCILSFLSCFFPSFSRQFGAAMGRFRFAPKNLHQTSITTSVASQTTIPSTGPTTSTAISSAMAHDLGLSLTIVAALILSMLMERFPPVWTHCHRTFEYWIWRDTAECGSSTTWGSFLTWHVPVVLQTPPC
jgi:hypothetical protein